MPERFTESWLAEYQARMAGMKNLPVLPDQIEFSLPLLLKLPNASIGHHWKAAYGYRQKLLPIVTEAVKSWLAHQPMRRARLTVTRVSTASQRADEDNCYASLKPLVDLLLIKSKTHPHSLGILTDDNPDLLEIIACSERCLHRQEQRTEVLIERK
jgi:hypothetical protein